MQVDVTYQNKSLLITEWHTHYDQCSKIIISSIWSYLLPNLWAVAKLATNKSIIVISICFSGQPHLRSEDRYRHITNDRARVPTVYPIKRKRSHERGLTLEERLVWLFESYFQLWLFKCKFCYMMWHFLLNKCSRRERALSRSSGKAAQRAAPSPAVFNRPQSPTSTGVWSPTPSPTSPLPTHVYYTPVMDEPLALIKKPRKDPESAEEKTKTSATTQIQVGYQKHNKRCMFPQHVQWDLIKHHRCLGCHNL